MERIGKCGVQNEQNTFVRSCVLNGSNHRLTHFWPLGTNNAREIGDERPDPSDRLWALFDIANLGRDLALVSAGRSLADGRDCVLRAVFDLSAGLFNHGAFVYVSSA